MKIQVGKYYIGHDKRFWLKYLKILSTYKYHRRNMYKLHGWDWYGKFYHDLTYSGHSIQLLGFREIPEMVALLTPELQIPSKSAHFTHKEV